MYLSGSLEFFDVTCSRCVCKLYEHKQWQIWGGMENRACFGLLSYTIDVPSEVDERSSSSILRKLFLSPRRGSNPQPSGAQKSFSEYRA